MNEELDTLYCYKLDEGKNTLERYVIPAKEITFKKHSWNSKRDVFMFRVDFGTGAEYRYAVERRKLDKFLSSKVYTFNPDPSYGVNVMLAGIQEKVDKAEQQLVRFKRLAKLVERYKEEL